MWIYNIALKGGKIQRETISSAKELEFIINGLKAVGKFSYIRGPFRTIYQADLDEKLDKGER